MATNEAQTIQIRSALDEGTEFLRQTRDAAKGQRALALATLRGPGVREMYRGADGRAVPSFKRTVAYARLTAAYDGIDLALEALEEALADCEVAP